MSSTALTAGDVMNRSAALLNDLARTDYTYAVQVHYLNMAIDELAESLEESNSSPSNKTSDPITMAVGKNKLTPLENIDTPHYPFDLIEIQEVGERLGGSSDPFIGLSRKEFGTTLPANQSLLYWYWEDQCIKFNPSGAISIREIQLKYVSQALQIADTENSVIGTINARSYLSYKTAAFCAMFIGENETRAQVLEDQANKALERMTGISNKGKQQIMTRHRPFRASYKRRGY